MLLILYFEYICLLVQNKLTSFINYILDNWNETKQLKHFLNTIDVEKGKEEALAGKFPFSRKSFSFSIKISCNIVYVQN